jgi:hypothetical protein
MEATSRRRFQYGLRSLLLVVAAIAAVLGVVGFQIRGRVQVGFERPCFTHFPYAVDFRTGTSPTLVFVCATENEARTLAAQFDRHEFCSQVDSIANRSAPPSNRLLRPFSINTLHSQNLFCIKYDIAEWGRYRLDLRQMAYVSDRNDPDARLRNDAIHRAFEQASEALAQRVTAIQTWRHYP